MSNLYKNLNVKIKDSLSKEQRKTLAEIQQNTNNTKFYSSVKDSWFYLFYQRMTKTTRKRKTRKSKSYR